MNVSDFLKILSIDFQEKNTDKEFWDEPQLLIKTQRAYKQIQNDFPYFMLKENLSIKTGVEIYILKKEALQDNSLLIDGIDYKFCEYDDLYKYKDKKYYTLERNKLILAQVPTENKEAVISYKYKKEILTKECEIELPSRYDEGLRCLTLSYVYEKSRGNSKERDLSVHYLKRYNNEESKLKRKRSHTKDVTSDYQII